MNRQALNGTITRGALGLAICAYLAFVSLEAGATEYEVRVLDALPEDFVSFHDLDSIFEPRIPSLFGPNERGELGGNADPNGKSGVSPLKTFALRWNSDGEVSMLDLPEDAIVSHGYEINRRGTIVGWYGIGSRSVAALWDRDGTRTDLPSLTKNGIAQAYSINDRGTAVGQSNGVPVVWVQRGYIAQLPLPDGAAFGTAWSISDNEVIFGRVQLSDALLPRNTIVPVRVVTQYFPDVTKKASTGPNETSVGKPIASRSVVFLSADGKKKVTLSVDQYASASDAAAAYQTAVELSIAAPGFKPAASPNLGQEAFAGSSQVGAEMHFGLGARDGRLIISATHAGDIPVTPDNSNKLISLSGVELTTAKQVLGLVSKTVIWCRKGRC